MRPEELAPELLRRWWVIALAALVAALTGYLLVASEDETYTATGRVAAVAERADYWLDQYAKVRLNRRAPLITRPEFVADAIAAAGLDVDPGHARGALRISNETSTNTLFIHADDSDPQRAADVVNAIQGALLEWNQQQNDEMAARVGPESDEYPPRINLVAVEFAAVPTAPNGPATRSTTAAAALLGAVVGAAIVFVLIYRDTSLKTPEELARYLELPLLGIVPSATPMGKG